MDLVVEIDRASAAGLSDGAGARRRRRQFPVQGLVGRVGDDFSGGKEGHLGQTGVLKKAKSKLGHVTPARSPPDSDSDSRSTCAEADIETDIDWSEWIMSA